MELPYVRLVVAASVALLMARSGLKKKSLSKDGAAAAVTVGFLSSKSARPTLPQQLFRATLPPLTLPPLVLPCRSGGVLPLRRDAAAVVSTLAILQLLVSRASSL